MTSQFALLSSATIPYKFSTQLSSGLQRIVTTLHNFAHARRKGYFTLGNVGVS